MVIATADKRQRLAAWARAERVASVAEVPPGSNAGPPMDRYSLPRETPMSWCARFCRSGMIVVGMVGRLSRADLYDMASAMSMYSILLRHGAKVVSSHDSEPGDFRFILGRGGSDPLTVNEKDGGIHHVGIVSERVTNGDGEMLLVIDGNWANAVRQNVQYLQDDTALYLRFPDDETAATT